MPQALHRNAADITKSRRHYIKAADITKKPQALQNNNGAKNLRIILLYLIRVIVTIFINRNYYSFLLRFNEDT